MCVCERAGEDGGCVLQRERERESEWCVCMCLRESRRGKEKGGCVTG